jgi:hypothetical protein
MSLVKYIGALCFCAVLSGCETVPVEDALVVKAKTILVMPADSLHQQLDPFYRDVQHRLATGISEKGFSVTTIEGREYKKLYNEALTVSGSVYEPGVGKQVPLNRGAFSKALIDLVSERKRFDIVVLPEMLLRTAIVDGDKAVWDGIDQKFTWVEKPDDIYRLPAKASGLSLRLAAYTDQGAEVMVKFTGIALPYNIRNDNGRFVFELKDPLFSREELNEGVDLSLKSFLKQVELND